MPFQSEKQRRYMFVHHPKIAHSWAHEGHEDPAESGEYGEPAKKRKKTDWKKERDKEHGRG